MARFINDTPVAELKVVGSKGSVRLSATLNSGAFKSLIPKEFAEKLGLPIRETMEDVTGVFGRGRVEIHWCELRFMDKLVSRTVICHDIPVKRGIEPVERDYCRSIIGRDVLKNFKVQVDWKNKIIGFSDP